MSEIAGFVIGLVCISLSFFPEATQQELEMFIVTTTTLSCMLI